MILAGVVAGGGGGRSWKPAASQRLQENTDEIQSLSFSALNPQCAQLYILAHLHLLRKTSPIPRTFLWGGKLGFELLWGLAVSRTELFQGTEFFGPLAIWLDTLSNVPVENRDVSTVQCFPPLLFRGGGGHVILLRC